MSQVSVPAAEPGNYAAGSRLERRHHLCAVAFGIPVSDGDSRLVQPLCRGVAAVEQLGPDFCLEALDEALGRGQPEIFNTDKGVQYTSREFTGRLETAAVAISMDGRGRALDNVFVERLWRSVKYEEVYLKDYASGAECHAGLAAYLKFYC